LDFGLFVRRFLEHATSLFVAFTALLVSIPPLIQGIKELIKVFKHRKAKQKGEVLDGASHPRRFIYPLVISLVLVGVAGLVLKGRASVVETGKSIGNAPTFSVDENYVATGKMGDTGDVTINKQPDLIRFVYQVEGHGPHEWEYKYIHGKENPQPAQFAGVMYLDPRGNWGTDPDGGYDLRTCHRAIKWEARTTEGEVNVEFVIGGDKRQWSPKGNEQYPFPNSIDKSLGVKHLTAQWQPLGQPLEADLSKLADDRFKRVIGGFGWVIAWDSNGVKLNKDQTGPEKSKTFTIEIRNIRYEK
jgi:hypothetical protein